MEILILFAHPTSYLLDSYFLFHLYLKPCDIKTSPLYFHFIDSKSVEDFVLALTSSPLQQPKNWWEIFIIGYSL